ncbi:MAG: hypothetical protein JWQ19_3963 [Subtercola sp.]|nr:hypothetical protein [Subtercola sp.]
MPLHLLAPKATATKVDDLVKAVADVMSVYDPPGPSRIAAHQAEVDVITKTMNELYKLQVKDIQGRRRRHLR